MGPAQLAWPGQEFTSELSYFVDGGQGNPQLGAACLCGGMSGMFGIWVFTSQGAHGSPVLKCGFFVLAGALVGLASGFEPCAALRLDAARLFHPFHLSLLSMPRREADCASRQLGVLVALLHTERDICRAMPGLQALGWGCVPQDPLHPCALRDGDSQKSPQSY